MLRSTLKIAFIVASISYLCLGLLSAAVIGLGTLLSVTGEYSMTSLVERMGWRAIGLIGVRSGLYLLWASVFGWSSRLIVMNQAGTDDRDGVLRWLFYSLLLVGCFDLLQTYMALGATGRSRGVWPDISFEGGWSIERTFFLMSGLLRSLSAYEAVLGLRVGFAGALLASGVCCLVRRSVRSAPH